MKQTIRKTKFAIKSILSLLFLVAMTFGMSKAASAAPMTEIATNTDVIDHTTSEQSERYYTFTMDKTGYYQIEFGVPDVTANTKAGWVLELYNFETNNLMMRKEVKSKTILPELPFKQGSKFYIKMSMPQNTNALAYNLDYSLKVNTVERNDWEQELNDTVATANVLKSNQKLIGSLYQCDDTDYYTYTVDTTGYFNMNFAVEDLTMSTGSGWRVMIYHAKNYEKLLTYSFDKTTTLPEMNFAKGTQLYIQVERNVKVTDASVPSNVPYSITMNATNNSLWEKETLCLASDAWGTRTKNATALTLSKTLTGNLWSVDDDDLYKIVMKDNGYLTVTFDPNEVENNLGSGYQVKLVSSSGKQAFDLNTKVKLSKKCYLTKGTYYFEIGRGINCTDASVPTLRNYKLKASASKSAPSKVANVKVKKQKGNKVNASWKKQSSVSGYQVRYATNSKLTKATMKTTSKNTYSISKIKKGKTYYVQVRSYKTDTFGKKIYGTWSVTKKIKY
ncbi:beta-galactosidase [Lachnospiraceae bacterium KM106-2]|nr:beta-galactosidase [Lachnospiraceae bacterium KM106-2]